MFRYQENMYSKLWIADGVLHFVYKPIDYLDLKAARYIVRERMKYQGGNSYPILCDISGISDAGKSARDFLALEGSTLAKAVAIVDKRDIAMAMFQVYTKRNKPIIPTLFFDDTEKALVFLKSYV